MAAYTSSTTIGLPTSGAYLAGDTFQDARGSKYICMKAGQPGEWARTGPFQEIDASEIDGNGGAGAGTLTNAPVAGNPAKWIKVMIDGVEYRVPAWAIV